MNYTIISDVLVFEHSIEARTRAKNKCLPQNIFLATLLVFAPLPSPITSPERVYKPFAKRTAHAR